MVTGALSKMVVVISMICGAGIILIMAFQNRASESHAQKALQESEISRQNMERKEQELKDNLTKLEAVQLEEKKRQWVNEGLTLGTNIIRNNSEFQKLCDELLSFLVKYIKANQAGLFLLNDEDAEDVHMKLVAAYAYDRKKFLTKRIEIGEGIMGQAYLERGTVYLKEIPDNYLQITSGLGFAMPTVLVIVPLKIEGQVHGLIEVASFHDLEEHVIKYLETMGENIASSLQSVRSSTKTQHLLAMSQQQTEEMRAQEEEMRQNMEELSATQEEMSRKELEYLRRIEELERRLN
jgi:putative methionine-R-sulfoxide reductase with GAF domain